VRSYSDLQLYRRCPRLYAFTVILGYQPIIESEPVNTGTFVHKAISAHFRGTPWLEAIRGEANTLLAGLDHLDNPERQAKAMKELEAASSRAEVLANRYVIHWAKDYKAVLIEPEITLGNVVIHPDLIAYYHDMRTIVDFKTSRSPDNRAYPFSGQTDLYAYVLENTGTHINLVIYDVISDDGIYRLDRPPRLAKGEYLYRQIEKLPDEPAELLAEPHWEWDCPSKCQFFLPCYLADDDWEATEDFLEANYGKREGSEIAAE